MRIKAAIIDFDGTLTSRDMSDLLAKEVGKEQESAELNRLFHEGKLDGITGLVQRINFFKGLNRTDLKKIIADNDYLRPGAYELFTYFKDHNIVTIIASGSIVQFLELYQSKLGVDYLVGSRPKMDGDTIVSISEDDYPGTDFKVIGSQAILSTLDITSEEVIAIGDSPADIGIFNLAAMSVGVNIKESMRQHVDHEVIDNLADIIPILDAVNTK